MLDPKISFVLNVVIATLAVIVAGGPHMFPEYVPAVWAGGIVQTSAFIVAIVSGVNGALHGYSAPVKGPLVSAANVAGKVAAIMLLALLIAPLIGGGATTARAQAPAPLPTDAVTLPFPLPGASSSGQTIFPTPKPSPTGTSSLSGDLGSIVNDINADTIADLTAGKAAFDALNDTAGSACYAALLTQLTAIQSATKTASGANALPKVHLFFDVAIARTLALAANANSPINNACAAVAQQTGQSVVSLVNGAVTGVLKVGPLFGLP